MMITKKISIEHTHKEMRKEFKHFTTKKNLLSTKEDTNTGNEGQKINYNTYGKQIDNDKSSSY